MAIEIHGANAALSIDGQPPVAPTVTGSDPIIFGLPDLAPGATYVLTFTVKVTDSIGTDAVNQRLSEQRAASVGNYLMSKGLVRDRFILTGAGKTRPIASNDTDAGRAQNRRVEITLVPVRS